MSTLALIFAGFLLLLIVLDKIPGIRYLVKPLIDTVSWVVSTLFGSAGSWLLYFVKSMFRAHVVFYRHLTSRRVDLDPSERLRRGWQ